MLEAGVIAAVSVGATALVGVIGSCLAPLCRKQKNSVDQHQIDTAQDAVTVSYGGDTEVKCSLLCCSYSTLKKPVFTFISREFNNSASDVEAARQANGYQNYISSQPRNSNSVSPAPQQPNTASAQASTVTASDTPLSDVDVRAIMSSDRKDHYSLEECDFNADGSWRVKGFNMHKNPEPDPNNPRNTNIGGEIMRQAIKPIQDMVANLTQQKLLISHHQQQSSEHPPLILPPTNHVPIMGAHNDATDG